METQSRKSKANNCYDSWVASWFI